MSDRILTLFGEEMFPDQPKPGSKGRGKKKDSETKEETDPAEQTQQEEVVEAPVAEIPVIAFDEPSTTTDVPVSEIFSAPGSLTEQPVETPAEPVQEKEEIFSERPVPEQEIIDIVYADDTFYSDISPDEQEPEVFWKQFFISEEVAKAVEEKQPDAEPEAPENGQEEGKKEDSGFHIAEEPTPVTEHLQLSENVPGEETELLGEKEPVQDLIPEPEIIVAVVDPLSEPVIEDSIFFEPPTPVAEEKFNEEQEVATDTNEANENAPEAQFVTETITETISFEFPVNEDLLTTGETKEDNKEHPHVEEETAEKPATSEAEKEEEREEEIGTFIVHGTHEENDFSFPEINSKEEEEITEPHVAAQAEPEEAEENDYEELYREDQDELTESAIHISDEELENEIANIEQELRNAGSETFSGAEEEIRYIHEEDIAEEEAVNPVEQTVQEEPVAKQELPDGMHEDIAAAMLHAIAAIEDMIVATDVDNISAPVPTELPVADEPVDVSAGIDEAIVAAEIMLAAEEAQNSIANDETTAAAEPEKEEETVAVEEGLEQPVAPKTKKAKTEEPDQENLPADWNGEKNYYSIGEVAELFKVKTSHIRFWTNEFKLKVRTTRKGDRLYTPDQVREIRTIYHLVKERGFTLAGAKARLKSQSKKDIETIDLKDSLIQLRNMLVAIKNQLGAEKKK